jgi:hypothetical protein
VYFGSWRLGWTTSCRLDEAHETATAEKQLATTMVSTRVLNCGPASVAFAVAVIVNIVALGQRSLAVWVGLLAAAPALE